MAEASESNTSFTLNKQPVEQVIRRTNDHPQAATHEAGDRWRDQDIHVRAPVPPVPAAQDLGWWDVSFLIINKMIGTGIFTTPITTLQYTRSRGMTLAFWLIGFLYTLLSTWMYLEFARKLPYTGGELIYLDSTRRLPRLLLYTWYSFYFVILYTTCTNSLQFAFRVIQASDLSITKPDEADTRLMCFLAFTILGFVCLLLYFSSQKSRWANGLTAVAKILLLLVVVSAGGVYLTKHAPVSWSKAIAETDGLDSAGAKGWSQGLLIVFFSFNGWENATFVAGEIPEYSVLRRGFIIAVIVVGTLYCTLIGIVCSAYDNGTGDDMSNYMAVFFGNNAAAERASAILIALSAVGSMISISYTAVRVKQVIGWTNILPLSNIWRRTDLSRRLYAFLPRLAENEVDQAEMVRQGTPEGGIILHFLVSTIHLGIASRLKLSDAILVQGQALIYGHFIFEAILGVKFAYNFDAEPTSENALGPRWNSRQPDELFTNNRQGYILLGLGITLSSLFVLAIQLITGADGPGVWYFCAMAAIVALASIYWLIFVQPWSRSRTSARRVRAGMGITAQTHGVDDRMNAWRQCSQCAWTRSRGTRRRSIEAHRHREDGYMEYNKVDFESSRSGRAVEQVVELFGAVGGGDERPYQIAEGANGIEMNGHVRV